MITFFSYSPDVLVAEDFLQKKCKEFNIVYKFYSSTYITNRRDKKPDLLQNVILIFRQIQNNEKLPSGLVLQLCTDFTNEPVLKYNVALLLVSTAACRLGGSPSVIKEIPPLTLA